MDLRCMSEGITWSINVPSSCFSGYIVSLDNNPTVSLTVNDTTMMVSFQMLIEEGFTPCMNHSITVTPTLKMFCEVDIGGASNTVFINDTSMQSVIVLVCMYNCLRDKKKL